MNTDFEALNQKLEEKYIGALKSHKLCSCLIRSFPVKEIPTDIDFTKSNLLGIFPDEKFGFICFTYQIKEYVKE